MLCGSPVESPHGPVSCGQCQNCRVNHRRMWTGRILLEASEYKNMSSFVTLTYNEEEKPHDNGLRKRHLQDYFQKLRNRRIGAVRYFGVGEYGTKTKRPHYHAILFGFAPWDYESDLREAWKYGHVHVGECTPKSAAYTAQYCTKKLRDVPPPELSHLVPEFKLSSRKPAIGYAGVVRIKETLFGRHGAATLAKLGDVPNGIRIQGKVYPLGKHWVKYLRDEVFLGEYRPTGTPRHEWVIDYDEEKAQSLEAARQRAAAIEQKRYRRRFANSRTL